jgi:hypothetical protein
LAPSIYLIAASVITLCVLRLVPETVERNLGAAAMSDSPVREVAAT